MHVQQQALIILYSVACIVCTLFAAPMNHRRPREDDEMSVSTIRTLPGWWASGLTRGNSIKSRQSMDTLNIGWDEDIVDNRPLPPHMRGAGRGRPHEWNDFIPLPETDPPTEAEESHRGTGRVVSFAQASPEEDIEEEEEVIDNPVIEDPSTPSEEEDIEEEEDVIDNPVIEDPSTPLEEEDIEEEEDVIDNPVGNSSITPTAPQDHPSTEFTAVTNEEVKGQGGGVGLVEEELPVQVGGAVVKEVSHNTSPLVPNENSLMDEDDEEKARAEDNNALQRPSPSSAASSSWLSWTFGSVGNEDMAQVGEDGKEPASVSEEQEEAGGELKEETTSTIGINNKNIKNNNRSSSRVGITSSSLLQQTKDLKALASVDSSKSTLSDYNNIDQFDLISSNVKTVDKYSNTDPPAVESSVISSSLSSSSSFENSSSTNNSTVVTGAPNNSTNGSSVGAIISTTLANNEPSMSISSSDSTTFNTSTSSSSSGTTSFTSSTINSPMTPSFSDSISTNPSTKETFINTPSLRKQGYIPANQVKPKKSNSYGYIPVPPAAQLPQLSYVPTFTKCGDQNEKKPGNCLPETTQVATEQQVQQQAPEEKVASYESETNISTTSGSIPASTNLADDKSVIGGGGKAGEINDEGKSNGALPLPMAWNALSLLLAPPVNNFCLWNEEDFTVMAVGGPNKRTDYHVQPTEEYFYQVKGDMLLKIVDDKGFRDLEIKEGEMFLLPRNIPHNPVRFADTVGIVVERKRPEGLKDSLRWYCSKCSVIVYEESFICVDLGKQLKPVIDKFGSDESLRTCKQCGHINEAK